MRAEKQDQPTRDRARRLTKKTLAAGGVVTTLAVVGSFAGIGAATAAASDITEAEGRFLTFGGELGGLVNGLAEVHPAYSANPSGEPENSRSLDIGLLSALDIPLGDGLQLFGENPILGLGALGQYSRTDATSAYASSGLIGEEGAIAPAAGDDPAENAYLDLGPILEAAGLDVLLEDARLELGAISASAEVSADGEPVGDYQIADGTLLLTSPALDQLSSGLVSALDEVSGPINDLTGAGGVIEQTVDPLLGGLTSALDSVLSIVGGSVDLGVTANVELDLAAAVTSVLEEPLTSDDSVITIDLSSGTVSVDLARLVADTQGGDYDGTLNGLPANTELLNPDLVQAALDGALGSTLDQVPALVVNAVTDALNAAQVNIEISGGVDGPLGINLGQIQVQIAGALGDFLGVEGSEEPTISTDGTSVAGLPIGQLLEPLLQGITNTILPALVGPLSEAITDEGALDTIFRPIVETANAVLQPLFGLVTNNLLSLTANVQETGGTFTHEDAVNTDGTFTERALQLSLLPNSPILELSLGSATVRGDFDAAYDTSIEVEPGSIAQGETATVTGSGFEPGETVTVTLDGETIGTATAEEDGSFTLDYTAADDAETGDFVVEAVGDESNAPATDGLTITEGDAGADPEADANTDADVNGSSDDEGDVNANAASSASASANADDDSNAAAQAAAQAAANADADTAASAAADADATAAAESAATADASTNASSDVSSDVNASAQAAAQAAANADASSDANAEASAAADANAAAASQAASNADSSSDASTNAAADVNGSSDDNADADVNGSSDDEGDVNANAASSASASANADDDSNASAQAAAQAAANADADTAASAAADADATAAAESAATADASSDASSDVSSDVNASAQAAAQSAANADATSDANAEASAAADANAAAASQAASNADSSSDASSEAAANADADVNGSSDDEGDVNANASSAASASANADDESNASAQAAAQAAANADADTAASAAADADASAAAESAATADASSDASSDVSSDVNASAQAAAQAAANADASSDANAEASAAADANAAAAAQAASNADSSSDASSEADASSDSDASASASASSASASASNANASSDSNGGLSPTGGDMSLPLGGLAIAMLLAGAGVWFVTRRRANA